MNTSPTATIHSVIGYIDIYADEKHLHKVEFSRRKTPIKPSNKISLETARQLSNYFSDPRFKFTLPYLLDVSHHQHSVLDAMLAIPCGETRSYGEIAAEINSSPRAVGNACRRNPLAIVIPCHRITAKNSLGGFAGKTTGRLIDIKMQLLKHEKI